MVAQENDEELMAVASVAIHNSSSGRLIHEETNVSLAVMSVGDLKARINRGLNLPHRQIELANAADGRVLDDDWCSLAMATSSVGGSGSGGGGGGGIVEVGVGGAPLPPPTPPLVVFTLSSPRDVVILFPTDFEGRSLVLSWGNRGPCTLHDDGTAECTWLCPRTLCRWRYTGPRVIVVTGWYFGFGQVRRTDIQVHILYFSRRPARTSYITGITQ